MNGLLPRLWNIWYGRSRVVSVECIRLLKALGLMNLSGRESKNHGLTIEQIVENTWQKRTKFRRLLLQNGAVHLEFWMTNLANCQLLLRELQLYAVDVNLELAIYPHPISGPLNIIQRLEFLRFHMARHRDQIQQLRNHFNFPDKLILAILHL